MTFHYDLISLLRFMLHLRYTTSCVTCTSLCCWLCRAPSPLAHLPPRWSTPSSHSSHTCPPRSQQKYSFRGSSPPAQEDGWWRIWGWQEQIKDRYRSGKKSAIIQSPEPQMMHLSCGSIIILSEPNQTPDCLFGFRTTTSDCQGSTLYLKVQTCCKVQLCQHTRIGCPAHYYYWPAFWRSRKRVDRIFSQLQQHMVVFKAIPQ